MQGKESESADKNHIDDSEVPIAESQKKPDPINSSSEYVFDSLITPKFRDNAAVPLNMKIRVAKYHVPLMPSVDCRQSKNHMQKRVMKTPKYEAPEDI